MVVLQLIADNQPQRRQGCGPFHVIQLRRQLAEQTANLVDLFACLVVPGGQVADFPQHGDIHLLHGELFRIVVCQTVLAGGLSPPQLGCQLLRLQLSQFQADFLHAVFEFREVPDDGRQLRIRALIQRCLDVEAGDRHPVVRILLVGHVADHVVENPRIDRRDGNAMFPHVREGRHDQVLRSNRGDALDDVDRPVGGPDSHGAAAVLVERLDDGDCTQLLHDLCAALSALRDREGFVPREVFLFVDFDDLLRGKVNPLHSRVDEQDGVDFDRAGRLSHRVGQALERLSIAREAHPVLQKGFIGGTSRK